MVFPEGEELKIQRAAQILLDEKIARPILLGEERAARPPLVEYLVDPGTFRPLHTIYDPESEESGSTGVVDGLARIQQADVFEDDHLLAGVRHLDLDRAGGLLGHAAHMHH